MVFKGTTETDSLHPSLLSMPSLGKVKQIVGSTLRDLKGEGGSALVTNFESDETAAEFANLHKEDGLMGGADDLSKSIAIEELFFFPLLNLLRGFKKSRRLAGWRCYQCKQCFELRRGRNQPCYCYFNLERLKDLVRVAGKQKLV